VGKQPMQSNEDKDAETKSTVKLRARATLLFALLSHSRQRAAAFQHELQNKISHLETRVQQQEARLEQQEDTIAVIMQSASWRWTAPLRALKRVVRRSR
jgi:hypothetical protein